MRSRPQLTRLLLLSARFGLSLLCLAGLGLAGPLSAQVWTRLGPEGGFVNVFAVAPTDAQVVYAGMQGGGVFRSADGGRSWSAANSGLGNYSVLSLAVDPQNASVAYAGTVDGLYKTVTAGAGWVRFDRGIDPGRASISALAIDPATSSRVYAGTLAGLYISTNGGRRWTLAGGGLPANAAVSAFVIGSHGTILVGANGLFKSTDGGATWSDKTAGVHSEPFSFFDGLVADPSSPGTFYAVIQDIAYRSLDDGETFAVLPSLPAFSVFFLAVAPTGTVYAGTKGRGVLVSIDKGTSFKRLVQPSPGAVSPAFFATALAVEPDGTLLTGDQGRGVLRLEAGAHVWRDSSRGLLASMITSLSLDPKTSATLYAGLLGRGLQKSLDGGASWHDSSTGLASVFPTLTATAVAVDPKNPARVYAGVEGGGLARSDDFGAHFSKIADFSHLSGPDLGFCNTPNRLTFAPSSSTLFLGVDADSPLCGQYCLALRTTDSGKNLQCLPGLYTLRALAFDPIQPSLVYLVSLAELFRSTDSGLNFSPYSQAPDGEVLGLLVDPRQPGTLYAGTSLAGVFRSDDRGAHWTPGGSLPTGEVPVLLAEPGTGRLFAGVRGAEVYMSIDGGATWQLLGQGLPPGTFGGALVLDAGHHILYAGTAGSGVYKLELGGQR